MAEVTGLALPLFPLDHVLMPGCGLPLRVFEPRYRQLLEDVTAPGAPRRFGVVSLLEGREVNAAGLAAGPVRTAQIGTIAEILDVTGYPDGTSSVLTAGSSRFAIESRPESDRLYEIATVRILGEPAGEAPPGLAESVQADALAYVELLARVSGVSAVTQLVNSEPYPSDVVALSYRLASDAPLPRADRQELLEAESAAERLRALARILRRELTLLRETRTVAVSPAVLQEVLGLN
jgi:Lon protease-like protein